MGKKEEFLAKTITVTTKKELHDASKKNYGRIIISGDLYVDIKKEYDCYNGVGVLGKEAKKLAASYALVEIWALVPILGLVLCIPSIILLGSSVKDVAKLIRIVNYGQRVEENINLKNEAVLIHNDIIEKDRKWMKGADIVECGDNIDKFNDAIVMKANKVIVDKNKLDLVMSSYSDLFYVSDKMKDAIANNGIYHKYRVSNNGHQYSFTRIR